jgi:hypothetical protein
VVYSISVWIQWVVHSISVWIQWVVHSILALDSMGGSFYFHMDAFQYQAVLQGCEDMLTFFLRVHALLLSFSAVTLSFGFE